MGRLLLLIYNVKAAGEGGIAGYREQRTRSPSAHRVASLKTSSWARAGSRRYCRTRPAPCTTAAGRRFRSRRPWHSPSKGVPVVEQAWQLAMQPVEPAAALVDDDGEHSDVGLLAASRPGTSSRSSACPQLPVAVVVPCPAADISPSQLERPVRAGDGVP